MARARLRQLIVVHERFASRRSRGMHSAHTPAAEPDTACYATAASLDQRVTKETSVDRARSTSCQDAAHTSRRRATNRHLPAIKTAPMLDEWSQPSETG